MFCIAMCVFVLLSGRVEQHGHQAGLGLQGVSPHGPHQGKASLVTPTRSYLCYAN